MVDTGVYAMTRTLIQRLEIELASTRAGAVCVATVHPGDMTPAYGCSCDTSEGIAWTRVVQIQPTAAFPQPLAQPVQPGRVVQLAATIELGVDRCYWNTDDNTMPTPAILDSLARDALDDAAAMRRAALCGDLGEVVLGPWMPRGPLGGIHGGTMTVTVLVDTCGCGVPMPPLDSVTPPLPGDPRT